MTQLVEVARALARRQPLPLGQRLLSPVRRQALAHTLSDYAPRARLLEQGLAQGEPTAQAGLSRLAESALEDFRADVLLQSRTRPILRAAAAVDRVWNGPTAPEHMDDPSLDAERRTRIVEALDGFNEVIGSYGLFLEALEPLFLKDRTTKVLDLASGHGGFPLSVARLARDKGLNLEVTATDLQREYLDVGAATARREGLDVRFMVQDALDLSNLAAHPPDIVVCTQALHHFPPGLIACMFDQAARIATRGVVFIDGIRNMVYSLAVASYGFTVARVPGFVHDGVISLRRFFSIEELDLLANLVPRAARAEALFIRPAHVAVRLQKA